MSAQTVRIEEIKGTSNQVIAKIKALIHAGNIRRLIINNKEGKALLNIPLTVGVIGAILAPQVAVLAAIAALFIDGSIVVEKMVDPSDEAVDEAVEGMFEI